MELAKNKKNGIDWQNFMQLEMSPIKMIRNLVKNPVLTEKSSKVLVAKNQYTFDVDIRLTKPQIKKLFEDLFEVKIFAINTHRLPQKKTQLGRATGFKPKFKRAILTLKKGESISLNKIYSLN
uniref:Large ribosomal subunit protein uL23c n=1 Tax=Jenufa perforata TaxID=993091 RepID=A0A0S2LNG9_9CHLO|nr:ribosomal protein L23 [Jenufa perforata]ALO62887.1 ribosomal protein L23 [Jenufa perforata]